MKRLALNVLIGFDRVLLPFSFLIAVLLEPVQFARDWRRIPWLWRRMWDDPL